MKSDNPREIECFTQSRIFLRIIAFLCERTVFGPCLIKMTTSKAGHGDSTNNKPSNS